MLMAGAVVACASMTVPATAQWIGSPGGDGAATVTAPTVPPAQMAPAAPMSTPTPMSTAPMSTPMPSEGFSPQGMAPGGMAPPGMSMGGGQPSPADAAMMKDCQSNVETLRNDLEKRGAALQGATKKKLPPTELCPMFRAFVTAQQKFSSYLSTNQTKCHVPPDVVKKLKDNSNQVAGVRDRVCKAAQLQESGGGGGGGGGGGPPPQGAVSQGLGLPTGLPPTTANSQKGGVFDTLGGNALR
jgi:hypothetical protein